MNSSRPKFLDEEPPHGYIAGVGRGAVGFNARSGAANVDKNVPKRFQAKHDDLMIIEASEDTKEDLEAERIYSGIEERLRSKKKSNKAPSVQIFNSAVSEQFSDLKRSLGSLSDTDWLNIPEAGNFTRKNKRQRLESHQQRQMYVAPDSLISSGGGLNLTKLTEERERLLGHRLDSVFNIGANLQKQDVNKYLKELDSDCMLFTNDMNSSLEDLAKVRAVLTAYRKADRKRPQSWIASARLEERARKFHLAKSIIDEGCQECPRDEDVWLENIRLNESNISICKELILEAIQFNGYSEKLWLKAIELETEPFNKVRVVRKALQRIPTSKNMWKIAIDSESNREESILMLEKATELIDSSVDLWIALINLQSPDSKREVLARAKKALPKSEQLLILSAQIEEELKTSSFEDLESLFSEGISALKLAGKVLTLEEWIDYCADIELQGYYPLTIGSLVKSVLFSQESINTTQILSKIKEYTEDVFITKREVIVNLLIMNPTKMSIWNTFMNLGTDSDKMKSIYKTWDKLLFENNIVHEHPVLLLVFSKKIWKNNKDPNKASKIIDKGLSIIPTCIDFWLAKIKLQIVTEAYNDAEQTFKVVIDKFRKNSVNIERLWYKYVSFLRFLKKNKDALQILQEVIEIYPTCENFRLQLAQIYLDESLPQKSKQVLISATEILPNHPKLWIAIAKINKDHLNKITTARSSLDVGLLKNPESYQIYLVKAQMEEQLGNKDHARLIIEEGLRICQKCPELWCLKIRFLERKSLRKSTFQDALHMTDNHSLVMTEIGKLFYKDHQYEKALRWFQHATTKSPKIGDGWIWLYKCLETLGRDTSELLLQVEEHEPKYGEQWISVSKNVKLQYLSSVKILKLCTNNII